MWLNWKGSEYMDLNKIKTICYFLIGIIVILIMAMSYTSNPTFGYLAISIVAVYFIFHRYYWRCPKCGNTDQARMNVARRTCGYIGTQYWNQGRTQEIRDRVLHL